MPRTFSASLASLLLAWAGLCSPLLQAQVFADAGLELLHNDNLGRAARNGVSDSGAAVSLGAGYHFQPLDFTGLTLLGKLQQQTWQHYDDLASLDATLQADVSHKFGIGSDKPVLSFAVAYTQRHAATRQRDAELWTLRLGLAQRVLERLQLRLDAWHEDSDGAARAPLPPLPGATWVPPSGRVHDFSAWSLGLQAELELGEAAWLSASWRYRDGPIIATLRSYSRVIPGARAGGQDPAFGAGAVAYQLDARSRVYALDYNHAVFRQSTWYVGAEYQHATAGNGNHYTATLLRSGFLHSF